DQLLAKLNEEGVKFLSTGVTLYQYSMPAATMEYAKGDSIKVRVIHNMKREVLPGIVDIGIKIEKE
ncbi:MAG: gliding motility lipoprotein GldH, partial [Prevotella sp.]|nr:gliding motility lipoprotein GldH [Prevotella sp.]